MYSIKMWKVIKYQEIVKILRIYLHKKEKLICTGIYLLLNIDTYSKVTFKFHKMQLQVKTNTLYVSIHLFFDRVYVYIFYSLVITYKVITYIV